MSYMAGGPSAQADGACLRFPDDLGNHRDITMENAAQYLLRAVGLSRTVPFQWAYIDKPQEGQMILLFLPANSPFPTDGIRYQENESRYTIPVNNGQMELELHEIKYGFIPNSGDTSASRVRKRYRLIRGGHPYLVLVHYSRGPQTPIVSSLMNEPVRPYPLRPISELGVFVMGERQGQRVPVGTGRQQQPSGMMGGSGAGIGGAGGMSGGMSGIGGMPGMGGGMNMNMSALQAQNSSMDILERRREQDRLRGQRERAANVAGARPPRANSPDLSDDENECISTRALATARYKRNHDFMNDVFRHAAFGSLPSSSNENVNPYSQFNLKEMEEKCRKMEQEIEVLKERSIRGSGMDVESRSDR